MFIFRQYVIVVTLLCCYEHNPLVDCKYAKWYSMMKSLKIAVLNSVFADSKFLQQFLRVRRNENGSCPIYQLRAPNQNTSISFVSLDGIGSYTACL